MREQWRLLIDAPAPGATNMARDEALLRLHAAGAVPSTLRLYRWSPACLSLGRFQRSAEIDAALCTAEGVDVVRRPSGGRALLHDHELTYAVVTNVAHPRFRSHTILATYQAVSLALLSGLRRLAVPVELAPGGRQRTHGSAACFDTPAAFELTVRGRKLVGSAQARHKEALLQHGAIPLAAHAGQLARLLATPPPHLGSRMITLDEALGHAVTFDQVAEALVAGFEAAWGIVLERGAWAPEEEALADHLRETCYLDTGWTWGR